MGNPYLDKSNPLAGNPYYEKSKSRNGGNKYDALVSQWNRDKRILEGAQRESQQLDNYNRQVIDEQQMNNLQQDSQQIDNYYRQMQPKANDYINILQSMQPVQPSYQQPTQPNYQPPVQPGSNPFDFNQWQNQANQPVQNYDGPAIVADKRTMAQKAQDALSTFFGQQLPEMGQHFASGIVEQFSLDKLFGKAFHTDPANFREDQNHANSITPGMAQGSNFAGQVVGAIAPTLGSAGVVGKPAAELAGKALQNAPSWAQKVIPGIVGAGATGAGYEAQRQIMDAAADPNSQTLGQRLGQIGSTAAEFAGYGAAYPVAGKILGGITKPILNNLSEGAQGALEQFGHSLPGHVIEGATSGALAGSMVGMGKGAIDAVQQGDPSQIWKGAIGEAGQESKEEFTEAIAFGIVKGLSNRFGVQVSPDTVQHVKTKVQDRAILDMPDDVKTDFHDAVDELVNHGYDEDQAKTIVLQQFTQTPEGAQHMAQAGEKVAEDLHREGMNTANAGTPESIDPATQPIAVHENDLPTVETTVKEGTQQSEPVLSAAPEVNKQGTIQEGLQDANQVQGENTLPTSENVQEQPKNHPSEELKRRRNEISNQIIDIEEKMNIGEMPEHVGQDQINELQGQIKQIEKQIRESKPTVAEAPKEIKPKDKKIVDHVKVGDFITTTMDKFPGTYEVMDGNDRGMLKIKNENGNIVAIGRGLVKEVVDGQKIEPKQELKQEPKQDFSSVQTGKPFTSTLFQGRGKTPEEIYGPDAVQEGRAVPILGKGEYYAPAEEDAKNYGDVTTHDVKLDNPLVINSDKQWYDLLKESGAKHLNSQDKWFYQEPDQIPAATEKLQNYVKDQGHDGIVVHVNDNTKALRESFGHSQAVVFHKTGKEEPIQDVKSIDKSSEDTSTKKDQPTTSEKETSSEKSSNTNSEFDYLNATEDEIKNEVVRRIAEDKIARAGFEKVLQTGNNDDMKGSRNGKIGNLRWALIPTMGKLQTNAKIDYYNNDRKRIVITIPLDELLSRYQSIKNSLPDFKDEGLLDNAVKQEEEKLKNKDEIKTRIEESNQKLKEQVSAMSDDEIIQHVADSIVTKALRETDFKTLTKLLKSNDIEEAFKQYTKMAFTTVSSLDPSSMANKIATFKPFRGDRRKKEVDQGFIKTQDGRSFTIPIRELFDLYRGEHTVSITNDSKKDGKKTEPKQENDKNTYTINRVGYPPFVVKRGDNVLEYIPHKDKFERVKVDSISHAKEEINGRQYGYFYPLDYMDQVAVGKFDHVFTERGNRVPFRWTIVESSQLITSHKHTDLSVNEEYPQELQPRDRSRKASEEQIDQIQKNLNPELLGQSPKASDGAPIVSWDGIVESGNGRVLAVQRYYYKHGGNSYKNWLVKHLNDFGIYQTNKKEVEKASYPILVRIRQYDPAFDREQFVKEANEQSTSAMSATEQAQADAKVLTGKMMVLFRPNDNGDVNTVENQPFITEFLGSVVGPSERSRYLTKDGGINQEGVTRIRNAVFAKAYGNPEAVSLLAESPDNNVRNITTAMLQASPMVAEMKDDIVNGKLQQLDITKDITDAMTKLSELRSQGMNVDIFLNQQSIFGEELSPEGKELLRFFDKEKRSIKNIRAVLIEYTRIVNELGHPDQMNLFGDEKPNKGQVLLNAIRRVVNEGNELQTSIFEAKQQNASETRSNDAQEKSEGSKNAQKDETKTNVELSINQDTEVHKNIEELANKLPEQKDESNKPVGDTFSQAIADRLKTLLHEGKVISSGDLYKIADEVYKGTQAQGRYTPKDAYDALELAVNQYLLEQNDMNLASWNMDDVKRNVEKLTDLTKKLPTQTKRTAEQEKFEQFSTPPAIAYVANWVAHVGTKDVVLEPSAGIGGLATFAYANGADVIVNELDPRRLEVLKNMPFDRFFKDDGEQINNILPKDVLPTTVIMNPPFSQAANRGVKDTKNSFKHVDQALKRLQDGGRLVAILGAGRSEELSSNKRFTDWINSLKDKYNVRATLSIDGKNYTKYGTSFNVQYVVIDKNGPTTGEILKSHVKTLDEAIDKLEGIANDRQEVFGGNRSTESTTTQSTSTTGSTKTTEGSRNHYGKGSSVSSSTHGVGNNGNQSTVQVDNGRRNDGSTESVQQNTQSDKTDERTNHDGRSGNVQQGDVSGESSGNSTKDTGSLDLETDNRRSNRNKVKKGKKELTDSIFEEYTPQKLRIKGVKKHPGKLAESAAMSAIEAPDISYVPKLSKDIIEEGKLSEAQLEAISYAGQAHQQLLPDGTRKGFFIGDGTGVGKGREISGIILDNFNQGRTKALWISENIGLFKDAKRDWTGTTGRSDKEVFKLPKVGEKVKANEGILFVPYGTLKSGIESANGGQGVKAKAGEKQARLDQIVEWLGEDFDGVIAFDEAHNMANAVAQKGARGMQDASITALAGLDLQKRLPKARFVYVSATGATEVSNLGYAERLGLWGQGTAFPNKNDFISKIMSGGIAAMELVARDMKALGVYIARSLSYDGVQYERHTQNLTKDQSEVYSKLAQGWQIVLQNINAALEETGVTSGGKTSGRNAGNAKGAAMSSFWSAQQRFFNQVLTGMQMPKVIEQAEADLKAGRSIVMQLVNTNEATQKRALAKAEEEGGDLEDLDLSPRDILLQFVDKSFPVFQYETVIDDNGNKSSQLVRDSNGDPVINAEAQAMKDKLMQELSLLKVPDNPLEMILNHFGTDQVAEITGRSERVVINKDTGLRKRESMTDASKDVDADDFMSGKKRILVFSNAGGTGRSYHADLTKENQQQRVHYLVQPGWQATKAVQGFGRTHRTNQASAPIYKLFTTNLKGQMRFVSSIARRLDQLGALTKGQRQTGSQGLFSSSDNMEGPLAADALERFYVNLVRNQIPGLRGQEVLEKMGLKDRLLDEDGRMKDAKETREVTKFLNRILVLEPDMQNAVFDAYQEILEGITAQAIANGTLDTGMENLKTDTANIVESTDIRIDEKTGSKTVYNQIEAGVKAVPVTLEEMMQDKGFVGVYQNERSKNVRALLERGTKTLPNGRIVKRYVLQGQEKMSFSMTDEIELEKSKWVKVDQKDAVNVWGEELKKVGPHRLETYHMISGTLLPIWDRLPQSITKVMRVALDNGETILGRIIPNNEIRTVLHRLGAEMRSQQIDIDSLPSKILDEGYTVVFANGWKLSKRRIQGEWRIELIGADYRHDSLFKRIGVFNERIGYQWRYFVPTGENSADVIRELANNNPISEVVKADQGDNESSVRSLAATAEKYDGGTPNVLTPKGAKQIGDTLAKAFDTVLRAAKPSNPRARADFDTHAYAGRSKMKHLFQWRVIGHELGHAFHEMGFRGDPQEMGEVSDYLYPTKLKGKLRREEGLAEFFQLWIADPQEAENLAPKTVKMVEQFIGADPQLQVAFDKVRTIAMYDLGGSPVQKAMGSISFIGEEKVDPLIGDEYTIEGYSGKTKGKAVRQLFNTVDFTIPFRHMMESLKGKKDRNGNEYDGIDIAKFAAMTGGGKERAREMFMSRPRDQFGRYITERSLQTIAEKGIDHIEKTLGDNLKEVNKLKFLEDTIPNQLRLRNKQVKEEPVAGYHIYSAIMQSQLSIIRHDKGGFKTLPIPYETAQEVIQWAEENLGNEILDNIKEYGESLSKVVMDKLEKSGVITSELRDIIEKKYDGWYLPTYAATQGTLIGGTIEGGRTSKNPVKRYKEQSGPIYDFLTSTMIKLAEVEQAVEMKRMLDGLQEATKFEGMGIFLQEEKRPTVAIQLTGEQIVQQVQGFLEEEQEDEIGSNAFKFFIPGGLDKLKAEPVVMNRNGDSQFYMRLSKDLFEALMAMRPVTQSVYMRYIAKLSSAFRYVNIVSPQYVYNQIVRDTFGAGIQKVDSRSIVKGLVRGALLSAGKGKDAEKIWDQYVSSGAFLSNAENVLHMVKRASITDGLLDTNIPGWKRTIKGKFHYLTEAPGNILQWQEQIHRLTEFEHRIKVLAKEYEIEPEKVFDGDLPLTPAEEKKVEKILTEAGYAGSEISANFSLHGANEDFRKATSAVSFLHGSLQGMYRESRMMLDPKTRWKAAARSLGYLVPITLLAWVAMKAIGDDDDDTPSEMRDRYWLIPIGGKDNPRLRLAVAKPHAYAIGINILERFLDWYGIFGQFGRKSDQARKPYEDISNVFKQAFVPPFNNQILQAALEIWANKNAFGGEIIPQSQKGLSPDLQVGPKTSEMAKVIGNLVGWSPRNIDYFIQQTGGTFGDIATETSNVVGGKKKIADVLTAQDGIESYPLIGKLIMGPGEGGSRIVDKFYKDYSKSQTLNDSMNKWIQIYKDTQKKPPVKFTDQDALLAQYQPAMDGVSKVLSELRSEIELINKDKEMTTKEKHEANLEIRYYQQFVAGYLYGYEPKQPANIDPSRLEIIKKELNKQIKTKMQGEKSRPGGPSQNGQIIQQFMQIK